MFDGKKQTITWVVLGANGQLGQDLCKRLPGYVIPLTRSEIDLTKPHNLFPILQHHRPDTLINCAAYNHVDRAESEPELAFMINSQAPQALALMCQQLAVRFVHFSTDYVFGQDVTRSLPYTESDVPGPLSIYGQSKREGELRVLETLPEALVVRTCGLYGRWGMGGKGTNFVETMLRLASEGKAIRVVDDQVCTPSYTVDVAEAVVKLLDRNADGLYHVVNSGCCSWYEFAREIFLQSGISAKLTAISSSDYPAIAKRPKYSVLSTQKLQNLGISLRQWKDALSAYLSERFSLNSQRSS